MSPLNTKRLHECRNLQHLLTVLLVAGDHLRLGVDDLATTQLVCSNLQTFANGFGT